MTLMRIHTRWAQHGRGALHEAAQQDENPLVKAFRHLNEYLEGLFDPHEVDCVTYITPFHQIIVSDQASGPLTSAALSSLSKFILYGFLRAEYPRAKEGIRLVASCIKKCVFEETDWQSDEVILMKLLELSALTLRCEAANLLTIGAVWDVYFTCISMHGTKSLSKILRSEAESTLRHLTLTAFGKIQEVLSVRACDVQPQPGGEGSVRRVEQLLAADPRSLSWDSGGHETSFSEPLGITCLLGRVMSLLSGLTDLQKDNVDEVTFALSLVNIALEAGGPSLGRIAPLVDILRGDVCRHLLRASQCDDLAVFSLALRVVFNLFMSIKDHMKVQLEVFLTSVHLRLLHQHGAASSSAAAFAREELALESLLEFCREPSLMYDLYTNYDCDVQCTNLFDSLLGLLCRRAVPSGYGGFLTSSALQNQEPLLVQHLSLSSSEQRDRGAHSSILNRLALDGVFAMLRMVASRCALAGSDGKAVRGRGAREEDSKGASGGYEPNMLELEVDQWCNSHDGTGTPPADPLELDDPPLSQSDLLERVDSLATVSSSEDPDVEFLSRTQTAEVLRQRKLKKQRLRLAAEKFNENPLKQDWIRLCIELGLLQPLPASAPSPQAASSAGKQSRESEPIVDARAVAGFLKSTAGLGKTQIGEYLSKGPPQLYPFHAEVLREYVDTFDFAGEGRQASFDKALRTFLGGFRLPGEAQCIDRLMEAFAHKLFSALGPGRPFKSADAAFILAFSTIMLNTDLHNPQMDPKKRMTKEQFISNNRKINDGEDLPAEYQEEIYVGIKSKQIQVDADMNDHTGAGVALDFSDTATWNKLLRKSAEDQEPAAFTPTVAARSKLALSVEEKDMFLVMAKPVLETLIVVLETSDDDQVVRRCLDSLGDYAAACVGLGLPQLLGDMVSLLTVRARLCLALSRQLYRKSSKSASGLSVMEVQLRRLTKYDTPVALEQLAAADFSTLLSANRVQGAGSGPDRLNWTGAHIIRGELMCKAIFFLADKFVHCLHADTWLAIVDLLLWLRSRGSLPHGLAVIRDVRDAAGNRLPLSTFGTDCFSATNGRAGLRRAASDSGDTPQKASWWSWLGSRSSGFDSYDYDALFPPGENVDSNRVLLGAQDEQTDASAAGKGVEEYARRALAASRVDAALLQASEAWDERQLLALLGSFLGSLSQLVSALTSPGEAGGDGDSPYALVGTELDAVLLLEWTVAVAVCNKRRMHVVWGRLHEFFRDVLEEGVDKLAATCPYFLERCVVCILRATAQMDGSSGAALLKGASPAAQSSSSQSVWLSLRLLRGVPGEVLVAIAGRIGAGVAGLLMDAPGAACISTMDQWYIVFSLLSAAALAEDGRRFAWGALGYLVERNLVNDMNFSPCRQLVVKFLHGAFSAAGTQAEAEVSPVGRRDATESRRVHDSMLYLMRLMLMALAGYSSSSSSCGQQTWQPRGRANGSLLDSIAVAPAGLATFPLPRAQQVGYDKSITVACVCFPSAEEVELLWFDSCRCLAELATNAALPDVCQCAVYCLDSVLIAADTVGLGDETWFRTASELLERLPLNLSTVTQRGDVIAIIENCIRCCSLVFHVVVSHVAQLRNVKDFPALWLRFVNVLAINVNMIPRAVNLHGELVDMISALLRLLRPPALSSSRPSADPHVASAQRVGLLGMVAGLLFESEPEPPAPPAADAAGSPSPAAADLSFSPTQFQGGVTGSEEADRGLLCGGWRSIVTACPWLTSALKENNQHLVADILRHVESYEQAKLLKQQGARVADAQSDAPPAARKIDHRAQTV